MGSFGENDCAEVIKINPITQIEISNIVYPLLTDLSFVIVKYHQKCFWDKKDFVFYSLILEEVWSIHTHYMPPLLQPSINVK